MRPDGAFSPAAGTAWTDSGDLQEGFRICWEERRRLLRSGTIVEATIIAAPRSTKNAAAAGDPSWSRPARAQHWSCGMKLHRGAYRHGLIHTVRATAAGVADITQLLELPRGQARELFGHQAYWKEDDRQLLESGG
jgi:IS5 family transposase